MRLFRYESVVMYSPTNLGAAYLLTYTRSLYETMSNLA